MTSNAALLPGPTTLRAIFVAVPVLTAMAMALSGCGSLPSAGPVKQRDGALVGLNGMSLYVFDRDVPHAGRNTCHAECARAWPPLEAETDVVPVGDWYVIKGSDARWHWTYKGRPVYFYAKDQKPGDRLGDGINGLWHLARP